MDNNRSANTIEIISDTAFKVDGILIDLVYLDHINNLPYTDRMQCFYAHERVTWLRILRNQYKKYKDNPTDKETRLLLNYLKAHNRWMIEQE